MVGNLVGRLRGLARQRFHLGRDDGKSPAGIAGAGGFNGGVQRQQIGLLGDRRDQLDHVADLLRCARQFADPAIGLLGLTHGGRCDLAGFFHAPSDLVDGGGKFFRRRRHRLHVAGGFFRGARNLARQALGRLRRPRQRSRRRLELHGGGRDVGDDGADRRLELVGKTNQLSAARGARRLVLRFLRGGIVLRPRDRLHLEFFHRTRHFAEFIPAPEPRQNDVEITAGEFTHRPAHRGDRPRDSRAQQKCPDDTEQEAAGGQHQDQLLGLADSCMRLGFKPLLIGEQIRLHRPRALVDRGRGLGHFGGQFVDLFRILDQLGKRLLVFLQQGGSFL